MVSWQFRRMVSMQFSCLAGDDFSTVFLLLQGSKTRFLDTMSMHIAVCGLTSFQRILYQSSVKETSRKEVREHSERQKMFNMASVCIFIPLFFIWWGTSELCVFCFWVEWYFWYPSWIYIWACDKRCSRLTRVCLYTPIYFCLTRVTRNCGCFYSVCIDE